MAPRQIDTAPGQPPRIQWTPASPELLGAQYPVRRQSSIPLNGWNNEQVTIEDIPGKPLAYILSDAIAPSSAQSSNSPSLPDDDSFRMYNNLDRGHTAAVMMHSPEPDDDGLSTDNLLETGSFSKPEPLVVLLRNSLVTYGGPQSGSSHKWLPVNRLIQYVTVSQVFYELQRALNFEISSGEVLTNQIATWAQKICQQQQYTNSHGTQGVVSCQRIFAILTLMGQVKDAPALVDTGLTDIHLPLGYQYEGNSKSYLYSYSDRTQRFSVPAEWEEHYIDLFVCYQAYMISPFFELKGNEVPFYDLHAKSVLPFIEENSKQRRQSGLHGTVYRIKIHAAHHDLHEASPALLHSEIRSQWSNFVGHQGLDELDDQGETPYFAVKELTAEYQGEEGFQKEVEAWRKCAGIHGHDHLIKLLAVWRQDNAWRLLQPWADGNLWDYWELHRSLHRDIDLVKWVVDQLLGLAEALRQIHRRRSNDLEVRLSGIHGDIKPQNILWFKERPQDSNKMGRLVICDFGFTSFHTKASISRVEPEGHSPTYKAPEFGRDHISRAYDIWSLGCVYLEFITWYLLGYEAVKYTFPDLRKSDDSGEPFFRIDKFFNRNQNGIPFVKESVRRWIRNLRSLEQCSKLFHDLLDLVEKELLVLDVMGRWGCTPLVRNLRRIQKDCNDNGDEYAVRGLASRIQQPSPVESNPMRSKRPGDTGLELHSDYSPSSTPAEPPFKTYLPFNSEESRHDEQQDLMGIDTRLSTPSRAEWTTAAIRPPHLEGSLISSEGMANEETPLLSGSDLSKLSGGVTGISVVDEMHLALEAEQGANEDGSSWQDGHPAFQMPHGVSQQSTEVDETAMDPGRHCEGKIHPDDKNPGLATLKNWLKALFPCIRQRGGNRPA